MTYNYAFEKRDYLRIDKLNGLNDSETFWDSVRKFTGHLTSDHAIKRWQHLAEIRFSELNCEDAE